jgi:DNA-binding NarL/FixJ family response regulator
VSYRVLIADDHALIRSGVRLALESDGTFDVVAEVVDGTQAVAEARRLEPDLCLVDFYMPHGEAQMIRELTRALPNSPVVVLTVSTLDDDLFAALAAGAAGFVPKATSADRLPSTLRGVMQGEAALPRRLTTKLIEEFRRRRSHPQERSGPLTPFGDRITGREEQVLELLAEGLATSQIAGALGVRDVTVRRHVAAIVHKLGAADRSGAIRLAREARNPAA